MAHRFKIIYKEYKSALNKLKYPDSWFWVRYTINPYSGCAHSCIYCDARSERYYLEQDFEHEIIVKKDIDKVLEQKIKRSRTMLPDVIGPGGVTDGWQPIEKELENTRKVLKVIAQYKYPIGISTKSSLIVRDLDILQKIAKDTWCTVAFTITTINEELTKFIEPFSSTPLERLNALRIIKEKASDIQVGINLIPIIPFLEDGKEDLEEIFEKAKKSGAEFILFAPGLTLRDLQAEFFIKKLKESKYNYVVKPLLELFKGQIYPPSDYVKKLHSILYSLSKDYDIAIREKRWIPNDFRKWNYKISELLLNHEYSDSVHTGKSDNNMKWAGLNLNNLNESILNVYRRGDLHKLKNFNKAVSSIVEPILQKALKTESINSIDKFLT
ncbi:MAG: radical SAM protein [Candidatus Thorarchaeota archaeon]